MLRRHDHTSRLNHQAHIYLLPVLLPQFTNSKASMTLSAALAHLNLIETHPAAYRLAFPEDSSSSFIPYKQQR